MATPIDGMFHPALYGKCPACEKPLAIVDYSGVVLCPRCKTGLMVVIGSDGPQWASAGRMPESYGAVNAMTAEECCGIIRGGEG